MNPAIVYVKWIGGHGLTKYSLFGFRIAASSSGGITLKKVLRPLVWWIVNLVLLRLAVTNGLSRFFIRISLLWVAF